MNEIANLCEKVGADVDHVRKGIGTDSRIGKRFLFPGVGYGGSCFPKDVQALYKTSKQNDYDFKILDAVMEVNATQKLKIANHIINYYNSPKTIAIWGLSFKPNTDDIREAPALYTIDLLLEKGYRIRAYDPEAMDNIEEIYGSKVTLCVDMYDCLKGANALAIMTEWNVFRNPDFDKISSLLKEKIIFDGRNLYDLDSMKDIEYKYYSIGRQSII